MDHLNTNINVSMIAGLNNELEGHKQIWIPLPAKEKLILHIREYQYRI